MDIELIRASAYEQLQVFLNRDEIKKIEFPDIYCRDERLTYELLFDNGIFFSDATVLQKQAARLLREILNVISTSEVRQHAIIAVKEELQKFEHLKAGGNLSDQPRLNVEYPYEGVAMEQVSPKYETNLLKIQNLAIKHFFESRRPVDPKKDEVTEWIKNKASNLEVSISDNIVDAIFTIIKPGDHNPRKKRA